MNKELKAKLLKTINICESLLNNKEFHVSGSEIDCIPHYLDAKTPTKAKKQNKILKIRQKIIGYFSWYIPKGGWVEGKLYLGNSFKDK